MSSFSVRDESGALVVRVEESSALNDFRSNSFRDELYELVEADSTSLVALDLSGVDFLSSSGVALLVGLKRRLEGKGGKLVLFGIQPAVEDLLRIIRLTQFFTLAPHAAAALALLRSLPTA